MYAASGWELATKRRLGKLVQANRHHLTRLEVDGTPVTDKHSSLTGSVEWNNRDPFDRMIAAQCMAVSLLLATADEGFQTILAVSPVSS